MSNADPFDFEKFPRGWLAFQVTRKRFIPTLLDNVQAYCAESPSFGLDELGTWDNDRLSLVIPKVIKGVNIQLQNGSIFGQPTGNGPPIRLFDKGSYALSAFNQMNGSTSLQEIASTIAVETGWELEQSFNYVRGLFLWLVLCGICAPLLPRVEAGK